MRVIVLVLASLSVTLSGCVVAEVATAPIDAVTTTQSEADEDRGKALRKREERIADLQRDLRDEQEDCSQGDEGACEKVQSIKSEIAALERVNP